MKKRLTAILLLITLTVGMCSFAPGALALGKDAVDTVRGTADAPGHDISVMSFNILEQDSSSSGYAPGSVRIEAVIKTVATYLPDVIGMQEVSDNAAVKSPSNSYAYKWKTYLPERMAELGYSYRSLHQESTNAGSNNTIGAGLMIFWKSDRFYLATDRTATGSGSLSNSYTVYYNGSKKTSTDSSRYYQWVALRDKQHTDSLFYMFNTHLSIKMNVDGNGNVTAPADFVAGAILRTKEAKTLAEVMKQKAAHCPCFATGDYNSAWDSSVLDYSYIKNYNTENPTHTVTLDDVGQIHEMTKSGYFADAAQVARHRITTLPGSVIDHTFFNNYYTEAIEHRTIYETYNSVQPSDHKALITYFNYRVAAKVGTQSSKYDVAAKTLTDASNSSSYTFNIELLLNTAESTKVHSYSILDEAGNTLVKATDAPFTVSLSKKVNRFTIVFHNNTTGSYAFNTVQATVYRSGAPSPTVKQTGGTNCYFANDAWHVVLTKAASTVTLQLTGTDGKLYTDSACTSSTALTIGNIPGGVTKYYIKSTLGDILPVLLCKETASISTDTKVLYCDDDIDEDISGTVAFIKDDGTVLLGANRSRMFASLTGALEKTVSGATVYVAPGTYRGTQNSTATSAATVTLLGNNAGISPLVRHDDLWQRSTDRLPESVITDGLQLSGNRNCNYTVKGFSFTGQAQGAILLTGSSSTANHTQTVDFEQNIFDGFFGQNDTNASIIHLNGSYAKKAGRIADNYFRASKDTAMTEGMLDSNGAALKGTATRGIFWRNAKGMTVENNLFINLHNVLYLMSENVSGSKQNGYADYCVQYNRFENCGLVYAPINTVGGDTYADVRFLYNDFVRSGAAGADAALTVNMNETSNVTTDYTKCKLTVFGNRFSECQKALYIGRTSHSSSSDVSKVKIAVNQNRFLQTNSFAYVDNNIKLNNILLHTWLSKESYEKYISDGTVQTLPSNWDFGYNFFLSSYRNGGVKNGYVLPYHYIHTTSRSTNGDGSYSYTKYFELSSGGSIPYYRNSSMEEYRTKSSDSWTSAVPTEVTVKEVKTMYDGKPHQPDIQAEDGAFLSFSTDESDKRSYESVCPSFTDIGTHTVYYQAEKPGKAVVSGTATVTITPKQQFCTFASKTVAFTGKGQSLDAPKAVTGSAVTYIYNGHTFDTPPAFTDVGSYEVCAIVTHENYEPVTLYATLTIEPGEQTCRFDDLTFIYDGTPKSLIAPLTIDGSTVIYTYNGIQTRILPEFTNVGVYEITVQVTHDQCKPFVKTATLTVLPKSAATVILNGFSGSYDGQPHGVTTTGELPPNAVITYSVDGGGFYAGAPSFTDVGIHTVTAKITAVGYTEITTNSAVIQITPISLDGISAVGYQGKADGQPHGITVAGTLPTDTVLYAADGSWQTTSVPSYTATGLHLVKVIVQRKNHTDAVCFAVVNLTDGPTELFDIAVTEDTDMWQLSLDASVTGNAEHDINILRCGMLSAPTGETLLSLLSGKTEPTVQNTVFAENDNALTRLPPDEQMQLSKTAAAVIGYAVVEIEGETYTVYTAIQ